MHCESMDRRFTQGDIKTETPLLASCADSMSICIRFFFEGHGSRIQALKSMKQSMWRPMAR